MHFFKTEPNKLITIQNPVDLKTRLLRQYIREWAKVLDTFHSKFKDHTFRDFSPQNKPASDCFDNETVRNIHKIFIMLLKPYGIPLDLIPTCFTILIERFLALDHINAVLKPLTDEQHPLELVYTHNQIDVSKTAARFLNQFDYDNLIQNPRLFMVATSTGMLSELEADFAALNLDDHGGVNPEMSQMIEDTFLDTIKYGQISTANFLLDRLNQDKQNDLMKDAIATIYHSLHTDKTLEFLWGKSSKAMQETIALYLTKRMDFDDKLLINQVFPFDVDFRDDVIEFIARNPQHRLCTDIIAMLKEPAKKIWLSTCMTFPNLNEQTAFINQIWDSMTEETQREFVMEFGERPECDNTQVITPLLKI